MPAFSTLPFLFAAQCAFLVWAGRVASARLGGRSRPLRAAWAAVLVLLLWGLVSSWLATTGVYDAPALLRTLPGLWLPTVPIALVGALVHLVPSVRAGVLDMAGAAPAQAFIAVQGLRILAIGTLVKTYRGEFPVHVELAIGLTDLAFGLSALAVHRLVRRRRLSADAVALWHLVGFLIIAIPGEVAIQSGLPGPLQTFSVPPTSEAMLDFPLVLAPSLVVPTFLLLNLLGARAALDQATELDSSRPIASVPDA